MKFRQFFKEKAVYLILLACIFAVAFSSFWAIRNAVQKMGPSQEQEAEEWTQPQQPAANEAENVPVIEQPRTSSAPSSTPSPSPAASQPAQASSAAPAASAQPSAPAASSSGWPVDGEVTRKFSGDELVYNETLGDWRTHNGVDIAAEAGAAVRSVSSGTVAACYSDPLWGYTVEVESGDRLYRYCGLAQSDSPKNGQSVSVGDELGKLGQVDAEQADGAHLHFEVLENGAYADPEKLTQTP